MRPALRAVLFDLDGVLVESFEAWHRLVDAVARDLGESPVPLEAYEEGWGQSVEEDARQFCGGRPPAEIEPVFVARFAEFASHLRVDPAAAPLLRELRRRGLATAIVTNTPEALARETVAGARLEPDLVVGTGRLAAKPAPDMVIAACAGLRVPAGASLFVGDTRFDREAARAAGVRFAGLRIAGDDTIERLDDVLGLLGR
ncbi:D-glycero-D-manno-heptose 1,7-bisphosphate phosphatase [Myxococcaceae bacterium]|jgi:phosphoglycolate phosphatase/AHBA synthesis associated protein|nr:D-glycero-D-manno-heptose 1,7-bisphosphate phosphatase [Myxococcaceae bacterium]